MVTFLEAGRMDKVSELMPTTIEKAVNGTPIAMVAKVVEPKRIEAFIAFELTKLASMVNVDERLNLQPHQIPIIAQGLMEDFKTENLADISVCFKRGARGCYGQIYRLDGAVITEWMRKYLEEKYQVIESNLMKEKDNPYDFNSKPRNSDQEPNPDRNLLALLKTVIGDVKPKSQNNDDANKYQREKLGYQPPSVEDLIVRKLHSMYMRDNHDIRTGKPLHTWIEESKWLEIDYDKKLDLAIKEIKAGKI